MVSSKTSDAASPDSRASPELSSRFSDPQYIGSGVSATVYRAYDNKLGRTVALKLLNPHLATDPISVERFKREIQITRSIEHPGVVTVYDLIKEGPQNERLSLVMEYIDGPSLKDYIRERHPIPPDKILTLIKSILDIIAECHGKDIIHRDLKPHNIMISSKGEVKILDFGIARMTTLSDITKTGTSLGSPEYMAPELFAANTYDPRTDIYSLGVIFYEMIVGSLPFQGDSLAVLFSQHLNDAPSPISGFRQDIPPYLENIVNKALAKQPHQRYLCIEEILSDLEKEEVILNRLPEVRMKDCIHCGKKTTVEIDICTRCGESKDTGRGKIFGTVLPKEDDFIKFKEYVQDSFRTEIFNEHYSPIVLSKMNIDEANALKKHALKNGIFLEVVENPERETVSEKVSPLIVLGCVMATLGLIALPHLAAIPLGLVDFRFANPKAILYPFLGFLFLLSFVGTSSYLSQNRLQNQPLLSSDDVFGRALLARFKWISKIIPELKKERTPSADGFVSSLLQKYIILSQIPNALTPSNRTSIDDLISESIQIANEASKIELMLSNADFQNTVHEYQLGLQRVDAQARNKKLETEIQLYGNLEERHSALNHRLIKILHFVNQMLGRALLEETAYTSQHLEKMKTTLSHLNAELLAVREIQNEITGKAA